MDDWNFKIFREKLMDAIKMFHTDKCSRVETYVDYNNIEYKVIIEKNKLGG